MRDDSLEIFYPYVDILKMKMPLLIAISWSSMAAFFNTYVFDDWSFLIYLVIMIFIDTVLGIWKAWKYHVSIVENIGAIKPDLLPKWILKRLKSFDDKGQFQIDSE